MDLQVLINIIWRAYSCQIGPLLPNYSSEIPLVGLQLMMSILYTFRNERENGLQVSDRSRPLPGSPSSCSLRVLPVLLQQYDTQGIPLAVQFGLKPRQQ